MRFLDVHLIQSFPPSNLNRDDTGSPKDAIFGGVRRARVSSQCFKRATRQGFEKVGVLETEKAIRTKRLAGELIDRVAGVDAPAEERERWTTAVWGLLGALGLSPDGHRRELTQYLLFIGPDEIDELATLVREHRAELEGDRASAVVATALHHGLLGKTTGAIDLALFGRMVADRPEGNIDGAVAVAHALSTHGVELEFDYYTAIDDLLGPEETGADMIGTVEFNAAVFYRYATVSVDELVRNLRGDREKACRALDVFLRAFVAAVPSGKQRVFAPFAPPSVVILEGRLDQPISLVNAFEAPVHHGGRGMLASSAAALDREWRQLRSHLGGEDSVYLGLAAIEGVRPSLEAIAGAAKTVGSIPEVIRGAVTVAEAR